MSSLDKIKSSESVTDIVLVILSEYAYNSNNWFRHCDALGVSTPG